MFASTVTMGSTSAGKSTFLIRLPPPIRTFDDSSTDEENQVHGRMPQNRKIAYGCVVDRLIRMTEKTNE